MLPGAWLTKQHLAASRIRGLGPIEGGVTMEIRYCSQIEANSKPRTFAGWTPMPCDGSLVLCLLLLCLRMLSLPTMPPRQFIQITEKKPIALEIHRRLRPNSLAASRKRKQCNLYSNATCTGTRTYSDVQNTEGLHRRFRQTFLNQPAI